MYLRVSENNKGLCVMVCIPTENGFMITHTFNKIQAVQMQEIPICVGHTGRSVLVCKKANDKMMTLPFEVCLIDKDVYDKHKNEEITIHTQERVFNRNLSGSQYVFVHEHNVDYITEQYETILDVKELKDGKCQPKTKNITLSDEDWAILDKNKKELEQ